ncbi:arsenate reductase/protein-tyrosine-phosphatase family protein [Dermabacteraceae bacterium P13101]
MSVYRVLTVCTGNVCRSPMGAALLRAALAGTPLEDRVVVESCGTSWEAEGEPIDPRTADALEEMGCPLPEHSARAMRQSEVAEWDLVLAMTANHLETVRRKMAALPEDSPKPDLFMWRYFDPSAPVNARDEELDVPDPWYSGPRAFRRTAKTLNRAVPSIILYMNVMLQRRGRG